MINHVKDATLRAILKCKDHPRILAIQNNCKNVIKFAFEEIDLESIEKEIHNLKINKTSQSSDIPTKIIRENVDIFAEFLWKIINSSIKSSTFLSCLKSADVTPLHKKEKKTKKITTDLKVFYQLYLNVLKNACLVRCLFILMKDFRNINMVSERGTVLNNVY